MAAPRVKKWPFTHQAHLLHLGLLLGLLSLLLGLLLGLCISLWHSLSLPICPFGAQCLGGVLGNIVQHCFDPLWDQGDDQVSLGGPFALHEASSFLAIDMYGDQLWVDTMLPLSWHLLLVTFLENILVTGGSHVFLVPDFQVVQRGSIGQAAVLGCLAATHTNCTIRCPVGLSLRNWRFSCSTKKAAGIVMALLSPNLMATDI